MKHGEIIERHTEKHYATFKGQTPNGEDVSASYCDSETTVTTRYCKYCDEEVNNKGNWLIGSIQCSKCGSRWD